ncbi:MAG: RNA-binding cell elongation regulator Jag/EloR, partial [Chloroflexota bacterium]
MNEKTTLEIIAPTVEEALSQGLSQLGLPAEAVSMEVLDAGSKGLFGLGGRQVRIRLTIKTDEEPVPAPKTPPAASKPGPKPVPAKKAAPKPQETTPSPRQAKGESDRLLTLTEETVSKLLAHMNLQARVSARYDDNDRAPHSGGANRQAINVDVRGDDLSILIGRRSETLNALQYVASLMVGKQVEQWVQLYLDVEGYRSRRERQLRQMARRMAEQAAKSGRRQTLEPMAAAERRIIHLELRDHPDVTTESAGEEPHRKVNIMP